MRKRITVGENLQVGYNPSLTRKVSEGVALRNSSISLNVRGFKNVENLQPNQYALVSQKNRNLIRSEDRSGVKEYIGLVIKIGNNLANEISSLITKGIENFTLVAFVSSNFIKKVRFDV